MVVNVARPVIVYKRVFELSSINYFFEFIPRTILVAMLSVFMKIL